MQALRAYDPTRRPASWTDIIRPGQFAAFVKDAASGVPCDADARPFSDRDAVTCIIFASFAEARAFCEAAVERHPSLRFDVFDAEGRTRPPLLTITSADRASGIETAPAQMRTRRLIAWTMIVLGVPLLVYAYAEFHQREIVLATFIGINMILYGARLLWMNMALRETERARQARVAQVTGEETRHE